MDNKNELAGACKRNLSGGVGEASAAPALGSLSKEQGAHMESVEFRVFGEKQSLESQLAALAARGRIVEFEAALAANPNVDAWLAVAWAAESGRMDCLSAALSRFDPSHHHAMAAQLALENGSDAVLEVVMGNPSIAQLADMARAASKLDNLSGLRSVCSKTKVPLALEEGSDAAAGRSLACPFQVAAGAGSARCMAELAKGMDAKDLAGGFDQLRSALDDAIGAGQPDCVAVALSVLPQDLGMVQEAFILACRLDRAEAAEFLAGGLPRDFDATEALWACAEMASLSCIPLAAPRANMEIVDDDGLSLVEAVLQRALDYCVDEDSDPAELARALLAAGAPYPRTDSRGVGMVEKCRQVGFEESAGLLEAVAASREAMAIEKETRRSDLRPRIKVL